MSWSPSLLLRAAGDERRLPLRGRLGGRAAAARGDRRRARVRAAGGGVLRGRRAARDPRRRAAPGWSRRRAGRRGCRSGSGWRRPASPPSPPRAVTGRRSSPRRGLREFLAPLPVAALISAPRPRRARGRGPRRDDEAARHRHPGGARRPRARPGRRPLRPGRAARPRASPAARRSRCAPRRPHEELAAEIELPEGTAGSQLERALELLVDRLLAAPQRRGRTLLALRLGAAARRRRQLERRAGAGPADRLGAGPAQRAGARGWRRCRRRRSRCACGRSRSARRSATRSSSRSAGRSSAAAASARRCARCAPPRAPRRCSRSSPVDPASRVPERRAILTPFPMSADEPARAASTRPRPGRGASRPDGVPLAVAGVEVEAVREEWLVEDRWWTPRPLRRRYFELVLADGRDAVVFREAAAGAGTGSGPERADARRRSLRRAARPLRLLLPRRRLDPGGAGRRRGRATAIPPSPSPTTTGSGARWSSRSPAGSSASGRSPAPS